ncbi:polyprenyl synthetase family protein [Streptomyces sp. SID8356]|uniref:polyprenyl synthetase family protein n=1 Tax=unclassified Streptomyces TaxID=2593676 RepID=UPI0003691B68|nr:MULTISPECIES: polyprenyl synthetase family protein [unclassified Streptomyces]MYT37698.1 polyprenyl synthetase family protein [Streptomyces sp. SID8356]
MARTPAVEHSFAAACPLPVGPGPSPCGAGAGPGAGAVDADVGGAVLRTARAVLAERVAQASEIDASFADELTGRVRDFTLEGGKRLRPRLLWWGMRACGAGDATTEAALRLGVALELIQTCALIHDDVMDRSRLRRGKPAVHIGLAASAGLSPESERGSAFGTSAAVLAGDLALVWADDTVAETALPIPVRRRVGAIWRSMRTEMVAGQFLDLHGQAAGDSSAARALRTACLKSALYSVERPLLLGAALADADERTTAALRLAGRGAGIAFQLRDDLLGVFGDPGLTGKPSGDDIREGKPTYLLAVARERAGATGDGGALDVLGRAVGNPDVTEDDLGNVRAVLEATGARAHVEREAEHLGEEAVRRLGEAVDVGSYAGRQLLALVRAVSGGRSGPSASAPAADEGPHGHDGRADQTLTTAEGGHSR